MAAGNELGIAGFAPTDGLTDYWSGTTMYLTENAKYLYVADIFPRIRLVSDTGLTGASYTYPITYDRANEIWALALKAYKPTTYILYGATNNLGTGGMIPSNYATYSTYLQAQAAWAQANGMDAYLIGNENLIGASHANTGMVPTVLTRASNVATAIFASAHGMTTGDYIFVSGGSTASYRVADTESAETIQCTVIDATTITYASTGVDGVAAGSYKVNWSAYEVVRKTKALGAIIQGIFTRGPIVYTESQGHVTPWINIGITPGTDIDLLGYNGYGTGVGDATRRAAWKAEVDLLWAAFGTNLIVTEHNVVLDDGNTEVGGLNHEEYGFEVVADAEIIWRYEYLRVLGVTQIYLYGTTEYPVFCNTWPSQVFGERYKEGYFKPLINKIRGLAVESEFFGTNKNTGYDTTSSVVDRTGSVIPNANAAYADTKLTTGNCITAGVGTYLGPVSFIWGSRYTCFFKAKFNSVSLGSARLMEGPSGQGIILTMNGVKVTHPAQNITSSSAFSIINEWHDYAIVYDGRFIRFYRDGAPVGAKAMTNDPLTIAGDFTIFNRSDLIRECNMDVCELQWYSRAFDPVQLASHYRSDPDNTDSLVFRYKFQEGTGTLIHDFSGNRNHATLTSGTWSAFTLDEEDYYNGLSTYGSTLTYEDSLWTQEVPSSPTWTRELPGNL